MTANDSENPIMKTSLCIVATALALGAGGSAIAQQHADHHPAPSSANSASQAKLSQGQIKKVDKEAGKVTIKHGPLENLDMLAMTMVFRPKDPGMLEKVHVGDSIRFRAEKVDGVYTVTEYQPAK